MASPLLRSASLLAAVVASSSMLVAAPVIAAQYWTPSAVLASFFPQAKKVSPRKITLTESEAKSIANDLGLASVKAEWSIYVGDGMPGYAVLDREKGMHEPIDFAVRFSADGAVERIEILEYREAYGDEVRRERFRDQFRGKTAKDPITVGKDIDIVSGASISSRSIALGVKRDALIIAVAKKNGVLP